MARVRNTTPKTALRGHSNQVPWVIRRAIGGLSEGSRRGYADAYRYGEFIDFRTDPDKSGVLRASVLDSGTVITGFPTAIVTDGQYIFAQDRNGALYQRTSLATWKKIYTAPNYSNGLAIYSTALYYAQQAKIGQYTISSGATNDGWQTAGLNTDTFHPLFNYQNFLCVGNGRYLETWDGTIWTGSANPAHALVFTGGERVTCMTQWRQYLMVGTQSGNINGVTSDVITPSPKGNIYLWDGISATFNSVVHMPGGVNALAVQNGVLLAWVGTQAEMYLYNGGQIVQRAKRFTNIASDSVQVLPYAVTNYQGRTLFGNALGTSINVPRGVYSYGDITKDFTPMTSYDYRVSTGSKTGVSLGIGSICPISNNEVLIGWQDTTAPGSPAANNFGIDYLNTAVGGYESTATYRSLIFDNLKPHLKRRPLSTRITLDQPLQVGEFINVYYRRDGESSWSQIGASTANDNYQQTVIVFSATTRQDNSTEYDGRGYQHEVRVDYGGTKLTRPAWNSIMTIMSEDPDTDPTPFRT